MVVTAPEVLREDAASALRSIGAEGSCADVIAEGLLTRYQEPHRCYHTLEHIDEMCQALRREPTTRPDDLLVATWYHDAVYDPASPTNEVDSADLADRELTAAGVDARTVARIAELVRLTAVHTAPAHDHDAQILLDADLSILGATPERYRRYAAQVRGEFSHVPDDLWRTGRASVLEGFLARPRLFATDGFHRRLDTAARRNLRDEIDRLRAPDG